MGQGIAVGVGVGVAFGVALDNIALGVGLGAGLGVVLGVAVSYQLRRGVEGGADENNSSPDKLHSAPDYESGEQPEKRGG